MLPEPQGARCVHGDEHGEPDQADGDETLRLMLHALDPFLVRGSSLGQ